MIWLKVAGKAFDIQPVAVRWNSDSLVYGKPAKASNVFQKSAGYGPDKALDEDSTTRWATDSGTHAAWLEVDIGEATPIGRVKIDECDEWGAHVQRFELQYQDGATWKTALTGTTIGNGYSQTFQPVTARRFRLNILEATEGPTLWELQLLAPAPGGKSPPKAP